MAVTDLEQFFCGKLLDFRFELRGRDD